MAEQLGIRAYARHRGVSHSAVQKAIHSGRLREAVRVDAKGRKRIDPSLADREWTLNTDAALQRDPRSAPPPGRTRDAGENVLESPARVVSTAPAEPSYARSRAVRETIQAKIAKVRLETMTGKLVDAEEVRAQAFKVHRIVRDALLNIPDRVAASVHAASSEHEVHTLLKQEITQVLQELVRDGRNS